MWLPTVELLRAAPDLAEPAPSDPIFASLLPEAGETTTITACTTNLWNSPLHLKF